MDADDVGALKAQIAALTAAVERIAGRAGPQRADLTIDELGRWYDRRATKQARYTLVPFLRDFGGLRVSEMTRARYIEWRDERGAEVTIQKRRRAVGTLNLELATAHAMFRAAVKADLLERSPLEGIEELRGQRSRETEIDPSAHAAAFALAPVIVRVFQTICIETGMRFNEVRLLRWEHILWNEREIHIPRENTKGKRTSRNVPLTDYLAAVLNEYHRENVSPFVFASPQKPAAPYSRSRLTDLCRPFLDKLPAAPGDRRVTTHDARHSTVSRLARGGFNSLAAMKLVGHATASQHWKYLHLSPEDRARARELLDGQRTRKG